MQQKDIYKSIRCPLYGFVDLTKKEIAVLDTPAMQRLSRIKQLSHSYVVYPGAVHNRLEHSIGTLFVAGKICDSLGLSPKQSKVIRLSALLHDVGQGPFSHIWEEPMRLINGSKFSHEDVSKLIIKSDPAISKALGADKDAVLEVLDGNSLSADIISSSLDADKLDYLRRDSYHTGVSYGGFDLDRVIHTLRIFPGENGREYLAIHEKGKDALENYRLARYAMHAQVYEHHARLSADDMFLKAVKISFNEKILKEQDFKLSNPNFVENFCRLDDARVKNHILEKGGADTKELILRINNRELLKRALEVEITEQGIHNAFKRRKIQQMDRKQIDDVEIKIASEAKISPAFVSVHLQSIKIKLYERFSEIIDPKQKPLYVLKKNGMPSIFDDETPFKISLDQINRLYVFCPETYKKTVAKAAKSILGLSD